MDTIERMNHMSTVPPSPPRTRRASFADGLTVRIDERGSGRPMLVLHGGWGPLTVAGLAEALSTHAHVLVPAHPGFAGAPPPPCVHPPHHLAIPSPHLSPRPPPPDPILLGP